MMKWILMCVTDTLSLQMDYRSLVHDKDDSIYAEIKVIVLDLRGFYVSPPSSEP